MILQVDILSCRKPFDIASLSSGEVVVSDYGCEAVKVFTSSGIGRLIIQGEFEYPRGVATNDDDFIFVLDSELGRVTIHSPSDGRILKTIAGMCSIRTAHTYTAIGYISLSDTWVV